jgi:hypothetical protein
VAGTGPVASRGYEAPTAEPFSATPGANGRQPPPSARRGGLPRHPLGHGPQLLALFRLGSVEVRDEDVARLSPLGFKHLNFLGRYSFTAPQIGSLRELRDPGEPDDEDDD